MGIEVVPVRGCRLLAQWVSLACVLLAHGAASPAQAQADFKDGVFGGWDVMQLEHACAMSLEYEGAGDTRLTLFRGVSGDHLVVVDNALWSVKAGESFEVEASLAGWEYTVPAEGVERRGRRGIRFLASENFVRDFAAGSGLTLRRGEVVIDDLSLGGTAAGVTALGRCHTMLKRKIAAAQREKDRLAHIPGDPFATPASGLTGIELAPLIPTADDFPSAATRRGDTGRVAYRLLVGRDGALKECRLTAPSGTAELDSATCDLLARRKPWIGHGQSDLDSSVFRGVVEWRHP